MSGKRAFISSGTEVWH